MFEAYDRPHAFGFHLGLSNTFVSGSSFNRHKLPHHAAIIPSCHSRQYRGCWPRHRSALGRLVLMEERLTSTPSSQVLPPGPRRDQLLIPRGVILHLKRACRDTLLAAAPCSSSGCLADLEQPPAWGSAYPLGIRRAPFLPWCRTHTQPSSDQTRPRLPRLLCWRFSDLPRPPGRLAG